MKECFHCQEKRCKQVGTQDYSQKWQRGNNSLLSKFLQTRRRKTKHFTEELQHENGSSLVSRICPNLTSVKFLVLVLDIQNATVISTPNFHSYSNAKVIKKQVWLKVQLWITSILQLPHLNNSELVAGNQM